MKEHKLTRRRVMKAATAAGMSTASALTLTPKDVKAADSDQVTIPFDVDGEIKRQVDADMMDWYYRARDATNQISGEFLTRDGVAAVGTVGGVPKDNPHVIVRLEDSNGKADERRGELPEERNAVRVETETASDSDFEEHCDPDFWSESYKDEFPGGMRVTATSNDGAGTNSSRMYDDGLNWFGWTTAGHVVDKCYGGQDVYHDADDQFYKIGVVSDIDEKRDVAFIEEDYNASTDWWNRNPDNFSDAEEILATVSEEGLVTIKDNGGDSEMYGIGGCHYTLELKNWNLDVDEEWRCSSTRYDQIEMEEGTLTDTQKGDSGGLYFAEDPNSAGDYYALGSHNGLFVLQDLSERAVGAQGFTIHDVHGKKWKQ